MYLTRRVRLPLILAAASLSLQNGAAAGGGGAPPLSRPAASAATFKNPVIDENFPDPGLLRAGGRYHAYATNGNGSNVPYAVSRDLVNWTVGGDAMPVLPGWVKGGRTWAPEVAAVPGGFALYYTAQDAESGRQCVGVAKAKTPEGPFTGVGQGPLVCQLGEGGSIDASPFTDADGQRYLLWKNDGNCCNQLTNIYIQPLSKDGLELTGKATALINNFEIWEGNVIEAPTLHRCGNTYYLLYSAGPFDSDLYAVGYATATRITGPYRKAAENPILASQGQVAGPGHQTVVTDGAGQTWLAHHAWQAGRTNDSVGYRSMHLAPIQFSGGKVKVGGPTLSPQQAPRP